MIKYFIYRFPILLVIINISVVILGTYGIFLKNVILSDYLLYLITGLIYLFHIRVIDDLKDFEHDRIKYKDRFLQKNKDFLNKFIVIAEILFFLILIINFQFKGYVSTIILILGWLYNIFSVKNFYIKSLKNNFFFYNLLNSFNLIFVIFYLYNNINPLTNFSFILVLHFIAVIFSFLLIEVGRKLKSKNDIKTEDNYIEKYGYSKNLNIILAILSIIFISENIIFYIFNLNILFRLIYLFIFISGFGIYIMHFLKKNSLYKYLGILFALIFYWISNLLLILLK